MRIAFISFEAPPDTLVGGIGTYIGQAARTLAINGHQVEVFAATGGPTRLVRVNGYITHLLTSDLAFEGRLRFSRLAGTAFAARHYQAPFEILESPEFLAEGADAKRLVPDIPLVIKLHMSMTLIRKINQPPLSLTGKWKDNIKSRLQPFVHLRRWKEYDYPAIERPIFLMADEIVAPCHAIADVTAEMWSLDRRKIYEVPYPFFPSPELLEIPVDPQTPASIQTVGYVGRLEQRKGVLDLAEAIPRILSQFPRTKFVLAGAAQASPVSGRDMRQYLEQKLSPYRDRITFLGRVAPEQLHRVFADMDVCVLPSLWENFPNACLEAMAAGRAVVASRAGGMAQQLDNGNAGLLIDPGAPDQITEGVCRLLGNPTLRTQLGKEARARVLSEYNPVRIGKLMIASYERAIEAARAKHPAGSS